MLPRAPTRLFRTNFVSLCRASGRSAAAESARISVYRMRYADLDLGASAGMAAVFGVSRSGLFRESLGSAGIPLIGSSCSDSGPP